MSQYNTTRKALILREYGRNVQNLVGYVSLLKTKKERSEKAISLIKIMKAINPKVRGVSEDSRKLWDDLFIISDFKLDIDSPYSMPEKNVLNKKISRLSYKQEPVKFRHYGRNIELLVQKASEQTDPSMQEKIITAAMRIMRGFNGTWNIDGSDLDLVIGNINDITKGKIKVDFEKIKKDVQASKQSYRPKNRTPKTYKGPKHNG